MTLLPCCLLLRSTFHTCPSSHPIFDLPPITLSSFFPSPPSSPLLKMYKHFALLALTGFRYTTLLRQHVLLLADVSCSTCALNKQLLFTLNLLVVIWGKTSPPTVLSSLHLFSLPMMLYLHVIDFFLFKYRRTPLLLCYYLSCVSTSRSDL